jgi:tetratricopeptide (TPR) repeat protein
MAAKKTTDDNKLPVNPDSALNPAWDVNEEKPDKTDFAVVPPSKYDISVPAGPAKSKKAEKAPKEKAPKEKADKPSKVKEPKQGGSNKKILIAAIAIILVAAIAACTVLFIVPLAKYSRANRLFAQGKYDEAIAAYTALGDYKDSHEKIKEVKAQIIDDRYASAAKLYDDSKFDEAKAIFEDLDGYKDSASYISNCNYQLGVKAMADKDYETALALLAESDLEEAAEHILECKYQICSADTTNSDEIYAMFKDLVAANYKDSEKILKEHFKWTISYVINQDRDDTETNLTEVDAKEYVYCHFTLEGGIPDGTAIIRAGYIVNDREELLIDAVIDDATAGDTYVITAAVDDPPSSGKITFFVHEGEEKTVIGTASANLK